MITGAVDIDPRDTNKAIGAAREELEDLSEEKSKKFIINNVSSKDEF